MPRYTHSVRTAGPFVVITNKKTEVNRYINPEQVVSFEERTEDTILLALSNGELLQLNEVSLNDLFYRITEARRFQ